MICALDSNVMKSLFLQKEQSIDSFIIRLRTKSMGHGFIIPPIVFYEIQRWLLAKKMYAKERSFSELCKMLTVGDFSYDVWVKATEVYAYLTQRGNQIPDADILSASFCLVNGYAIIADDKHFEYIVPLGLKYIKWEQ